MMRPLNTTIDSSLVTVGLEPKCTCPDNLKGNQCKHIVYALVTVLKAPARLRYQLAFLSSVRQLSHGPHCECRMPSNGLTYFYRSCEKYLRMLHLSPRKSTQPMTPQATGNPSRENVPSVTWTLMRSITKLYGVVPRVVTTFTSHALINTLRVKLAPWYDASIGMFPKFIATPCFTCA